MKKKFLYNCNIIFTGCTFEIEAENQESADKLLHTCINGISVDEFADDAEVVKATQKDYHLIDVNVSVDVDESVFEELLDAAHGIADGEDVDEYSYVNGKLSPDELDYFKSNYPREYQLLKEVNIL